MNDYIEDGRRLLLLDEELVPGKGLTPLTEPCELSVVDLSPKSAVKLVIAITKKKGDTCLSGYMSFFRE